MPGGKHRRFFVMLLVGPTKANKVKIFLGPCYMIKRAQTFVSGVQESILVDFRSQNKVKILHKVKTCQYCLANIKNFLTKTDKFIFFCIFLNF